MAWCSKCKKEYEKGTKRCPDCGEKLSRKAPEADSEDVPAFLTSVEDNAFLGMMEEVLGDAGIPTLSKPHDLADALMAYTGTIHLGADIYVPSKLLEQAREIIRNLEETLPGETTEDAGTYYEDE